MREKNISLCFCWLCWSVFVISFSSVSCSDWKPIAPPEEYYATKSTTCGSDCDAGRKYPFLGDEGNNQGVETQVKTTLVNPSVVFNKEPDYYQKNQKLDLEIFKPTEVSFFPSGEGKIYDSSLTNYQEVFRQSPSSFFTYKTFGGPGKTTKTVYYGDLELAKPKLVGDVKYYKPYKQSLKSDIKAPNFFDNTVNAYQSTKDNVFNEHCSLYKVSFRQDLYYQFIQYKVHMPELKEFTLCLWMRFHNHSHDHSLFSYGTKHHRQAIYMWASNLNEPGFFNMKVLGQTIFRLNYPIKLYKWYHTCQSWNGHTGEWQVWVDSHRIARGFHNLLVKQKIPGGGVAISGQENRHFGKGFQEIPHYMKGTGGLEGEITMLQLYKVALTAGKAYNDHTHHHSHHISTTTEPPELPTDEPSTTTDHPLLENGQLKQHINILELADALKKGKLELPDPHPHKQYYTEPLQHHLIGHAVPLAIHGNTLNFVGYPNHAIFKRNDESKASDVQPKADDSSETDKSSRRVKFISNVTDQVQVEKIKFASKKADVLDDDPMMALPQQLEVVKGNISADTSGETATDLFEIENDSSSSEEKSTRTGKRLRRHNSSNLSRNTNRTKRITSGEGPARYVTFGQKKRVSPVRRVTAKGGKEASKRHILFDTSYLNFGAPGLTGHDVVPSYGAVAPTGLSFDHLGYFGQDFSDLNTGGGGEQNLDDIDSDTKPRKEVELAEGEVRRIMDLCSGCHFDPFRKVAVISWRSTPKKIYSGTLFLKAKSECQNF